ncbi:MAG: hypothetical protein ACK5U2_20200, partial [Microcystis sp.]|uniref:hypothetical protein n=1 Tax=Microcystis sp. TaxID=1127 RepID=UPI00391D8670
EVVNYLIFREKVPEFSPRSPQRLALFEEKKSLKVLSNKVFRFIQQTLDSQQLTCGRMEKEFLPISLTPASWRSFR